MKNTLILFVLLMVQSCSSPQSKKITVDGINFVIPAGFDRYKVNEENDEILKLNYKNEMIITVQDNLGETIKKSKLLGEDFAIDMVHKMKFIMLKSTYKGYDDSKRVDYEVNGKKVTEQAFLTKESFGEAYYHYLIVETTNHYLELIISGKNNLKLEQKEIQQEFIKNIDQ